MTKRTKPDYSVVWAETGDNTKPLDSYIGQGWLAVKPPRQYFNWLDNRQDNAIAYLYQAGVPEWDDTTEYEGGFSYVQGSDNKVYKCLADSTGDDPTDQPANDAFWELAFAEKGDFYDLDERVDDLETQMGDGSGVTNAAAWREAISFLQAMYPVGSLYFNAVAADDPATLLGFGTWTKIEGRVLVGHNAADTDFDTLLETGGAKSHTLTAAQLPGTFTTEGFRSPADYADSVLTAAGGADAFSILNPYIVVSIWYRTA